jgi:hypothetical protein
MKAVFGGNPLFNIKAKENEKESKYKDRFTRR